MLSDIEDVPGVNTFPALISFLRGYLINVEKLFEIISERRMALENPRLLTALLIRTKLNKITFDQTADKQQKPQSLMIGTLAFYFKLFLFWGLSAI